MPIRICHVCSGHSDYDDRVFDRECLSLVDAGYEVHLVAKSDATKRFLKQGVMIHPAPRNNGRWSRLLARNRVSQIAASLNPDVYHVHEPELLGSVLKLAKGHPVIWDVHEPYVDYIRTKHWIPGIFRHLVSWIWDRYERSLLRRCAGVVVATQWLALRYQDLHSTVTVVANFPRLPLDMDVPRTFRPNSLVFTGILVPNRGLSDVFEAMAILRQRGIVVTLDIAGSPLTSEYFAHIMRQADQLGVRASITYHGILSRQDTMKLQRTCAIGLTPSHMTAGSLVGYPNKMFEFMMYGLPLVYSDLPTFRSVVEESKAGIPVEPCHPEQIADAVERLLANPGMARQFGENGKRAIRERYNWNMEWPKLRDLYLQVVCSAIKIN